MIDEAHRAMGNYSYCVAIREVTSNYLCVYDYVQYDCAFFLTLTAKLRCFSLFWSQLMAVPVELRILALTATPGCKFVIIHYFHL